MKNVRLPQSPALSRRRFAQTTLAVGAVLGFALGWLLEKALYRHFYKRDHLDQVLLTFGLIYIFEECRSIIWGDDVHNVGIPDALDWSIRLTDTLSYPAYRIFLLGVCLALALGLWWLLSRTKLGMKIRAGAFNSDMAQTLGIHIVRLHAWVFAMGVMLAFVAGMLISPLSSIYPYMGSQVLIMCFVVVVIGGIGSVRGALAASILIGIADTFGKVLHLEIGGFKVLPELSSMSVYLLMAVVLLWRPEGLFGKRV